MSITAHRTTGADTGIKERLQMLAPSLAALLYPFALKGFNASVTRIAEGGAGRARGSIDRPDRGAQSDSQRDRSNRFRARAEARDKRGISRPQGRATRPTARLADGHQGPARDRRAADDLRLAALSQPRART